MLERALDVSLQQLYDLFLADGIVVVASVGGDGESGRNGNTDVVHLCKVCTLTSKFITHVGATFCMTCAERVDSLYVVHEFL